LELVERGTQLLGKVLTVLTQYLSLLQLAVGVAQGVALQLELVVLAVEELTFQTIPAQPVIRQALAHPKEIMEVMVVLDSDLLLLVAVVVLVALAATILMQVKTVALAAMEPHQALAEVVLLMLPGAADTDQPMAAMVGRLT
jgi:hypothetical protein